MKASKILMSVLASLLIVAASAGAHAQLVLRAGHDQPTDGSYHILFEKFAELVKEKSNGEIEVQVFPGAQLGSELELAEGLRLGTIDFSAASVGNITPLLPKAGLLGAPYIVVSKEHRERLTSNDGRFFAALAEEVEAAGVGIKLLGLTTAGVRSVYDSQRPIHTPADLNGLKIRVMTSDIQMKAWETLGAIPTPLAFSEVYSGILSGVIDGAENSPMFLYSMKHFEGAKYFSLTEHMVAMGLMMVSETTWDRLTPEQQELITEAAAEAAAFEREYDETVSDEYLEKLVAEGVQVNEVDKEPFVALAAPLHDEIAAEVGAEALLAIIREEAAAVAQ